jgi:porin
VRFGKLVPTNDFDNVVRPVPAQDPSLNIPAVSGLLYTPIFVNPTILGFQPGYYNSAYGVTATLAPSKSWYLSRDLRRQWGSRCADRSRDTPDLQRPSLPDCRDWRRLAARCPGSFAVGAWDQTGQLTLKEYPTGFIAQDGAQGVYMLASQRLWRGSEGDGVSGFIQFGANDPRTALFAYRYFALGLTDLVSFRGRPGDSLGAGQDAVNIPVQLVLLTYDATCELCAEATKTLRQKPALRGAPPKCL